MISSFRPNKDTVLFNIKNIHLHLFSFIFICLQWDGLYTLLYKQFKILQYLMSGIQSNRSLGFLR